MDLVVYKWSRELSSTVADTAHITAKDTMTKAVAQ